MPCSAVSDQGAKILLDDIVTSAGTENFLQSLTSRLDANLTQPGWFGLGMKAHSLGAARATPPGLGTAVYVMALDKNLLMQHRAITAPGVMGSWKYESGYSTYFAAPAMTSKGELYFKGFDGVVYTKLLDSGSSSAVVGL